MEFLSIIFWILQGFEVVRPSAVQSLFVCVNNANNHQRRYERRVSFNTFDNRDAPDLSFNTGIRHRDYAYTQRSRTFLCGADDNEYSYDAIEWLIEELVEDGDEIICLRVVDPSSKFASDTGVKNETYKKEAQDLLEKIRNKNKTKEEVREKAIALVIEFAVGKVPEVFQKMVCLYHHHLTVTIIPIIKTHFPSPSRTSAAPNQQRKPVH